jgi:diguanylate cyclase (GGDEF)-like protein
MNSAHAKVARSSEPQPSRPRESAPPIDVLVVDDDRSTRRGLKSSIQLLNYPVRVASNGRDALVEYELRPAAIVLTDWSMPQMTGIELCVALKRLEPQPHVVMMTGNDGRARLLEALRAGADEFISKPVDLEELEVRLLAAARMVSAQRALSRRNDALRCESERAFRVARTDPLTTMANRLRMDEDLARAISDATRYGRRYCIAICDIDYFKRYNDRNGHLAGDAALRLVAETLRDGVRSSDTVYRFGGEEFLILFPEQSPEEVAIAMDRIRARVRALAIDNASVSESGVLTISAGVAELVGGRREEWLAQADTALYRAKGEGRDRIALG